MKQVQQKRRKDGPLEDWTEKELAGECSTEEAAPAKEEEDGPLEDWTEKELAGECSTEEAAVEAVPAERRMALLKIGERRSWPGNAALKRQL